MMRLLNIAALAITILVSFGLYKLKYDTSVAENTARRLHDEIETESQYLRILRAEWSHLDRADRIQRLSEKYLDLKPVDPEQIVRINDIPMAPVIAGGIEKPSVRIRGPLMATFGDSKGDGAAVAKPEPETEDMSGGGDDNG